MLNTCQEVRLGFVKELGYIGGNKGWDPLVMGLVLEHYMSKNNPVMNNFINHGVSRNMSVKKQTKHTDNRLTGLTHCGTSFK